MQELKYFMTQLTFENVTTHQTRAQFVREDIVQGEPALHIPSQIMLERETKCVPGGFDVPNIEFLEWPKWVGIGEWVRDQNFFKPPPPAEGTGDFFV